MMILPSSSSTFRVFLSRYSVMQIRLPLLLPIIASCQEARFEKEGFLSGQAAGLRDRGVPLQDISGGCTYSPSGMSSISRRFPVRRAFIYIIRFFSSRTLPFHGCFSIQRSSSGVMDTPLPPFCSRSFCAKDEGTSSFLFSEGRYIKITDLQSVIQVFSEKPLADFFQKALIGSCDDPDIHIADTRLQYASPLFPQHTQQPPPASFWEMSPISSRNIVPPLAISNTPALPPRLAPVKAPSSYPKARFPSESH